MGALLFLDLQSRVMKRWDKDGDHDGEYVDDDEDDDHYDHYDYHDDVDNNGGKKDRHVWIGIKTPSLFGLGG